jgi:hypothetical protein
LSGLVRQKAEYGTQPEDDQEAAGVLMKLGCKGCDENDPDSAWAAGNVEGSHGTRAAGSLGLAEASTVAFVRTYFVRRNSVL